MTKNFNTNTDNKEEWLTPPEIIQALGTFDLDPCAHHQTEDRGNSKTPLFKRRTRRWNINGMERAGMA